MSQKFWLMKSEPNVYSIDHLEQEKVCFWEGIRNYQARNLIRDELQEGDLAFFYHSNAKPPGIAGLMKIVKNSYPDHTSWDPSSTYYDPKSSEDNPRWFMVDVSFIEKFPLYVPLQELRDHPGLEDMKVLQKGSRLSIQPVTLKHFSIICELAKSSFSL
ncbi:EVE domain-containing protein [PVC group bacterium (ex Bugula neritina AB1)]|nr:EVE domain-containing protein [PVC group bacterium (ex Bugula neritina AB1)]